MALMEGRKRECVPVGVCLSAGSGRVTREPSEVSCERGPLGRHKEEPTLHPPPPSQGVTQS